MPDKDLALIKPVVMDSSGRQARISNNAKNKVDYGRAMASSIRSGHDQQQVEHQKRRAASTKESLRLKAQSSTRQAELDKPLRGESSGFTQAKAHAEMTTEDVGPALEAFRQDSPKMSKADASFESGHINAVHENAMARNPGSGEAMAKGASLPKPNPNSLRSKYKASPAGKAEAWRIGKLGKMGGTALGIGGGIMGAVDAADDYKEMQTGPSRMDLKTGKIVKRQGWGGGA